MPTRRSTTSTSRARAVQEEEPLASDSRVSSPRASKPPAFALFIVVMVLLVAAGLTLNKLVSSNRPADTQTPSTMGDKDLDGLVQRVARHIAVNTEENPSIATVEDPDALRVQNAQFYALASKGDRLLVWSDKAVLYSMSQDKILAVLMIQKAPEVPTTPTTSTAAVPEAAPTVEVRNGSGTAGLGRTLSTELKTAGMTTLAARDTTVKTVYPATLIYVAPGKEFPTWIPKIQETLGAGQIVTELPNETDLKGDVVVIVGSDARR